MSEPPRAARSKRTERRPGSHGAACDCVGIESVVYFSPYPPKDEKLSSETTLIACQKYCESKKSDGCRFGDGGKVDYEVGGGGFERKVAAKEGVFEAGGI